MVILMPKYYLFSGIDKGKGFTKEQALSLKKEFKDSLTITFIASSFSKYDENDNYYQNMLNFFKNIGIIIIKSYLIDNRISKEQAISCINSSTAIFIMGGNPHEEMQSIIEYNLVMELKNFKGIIMGVSAGSINMNKNICYIDDNDKILEYDGIGLTDYNIAPHLDFNNIEYLKEIFRVSKLRRTIGLPNDSFIMIDNDKEKIVGDYYYFDNETFEYNGANYDEIKHLGTIKLETERLILRRTTKEDINEFFYIQLNPKLRRFLGTHKVGNNPEKNKKFFDEDKYKEKDYYRWTMELKENHKVLGTIYLNIHDEKARTAGIDYWIREDEWGHGYTTEASKIVMDFAFNKLNLNRIESCGAKENTGTWKVMEKIGLKYEGERKNAMFYYYGGTQTIVMYGLTKEEYFTKDKN